MFEVDAISADHKDVIHDVVFDYYGRRMATCSSDQTVKIWDEDELGKLTVSSSWKAHSGSIWRISWAHPEFGQVLATCSFDRTASVWEEVAGEKVAATMTPARRWVRRTTLVDSRTSVTDVEFAPKYLGLLLATVSADGIIRIYEAPDIMNLSQWPVQHEIANKLPLSCISWNTSAYMLSSHLIAAGSDDTSMDTGKVLIFAYNESARKCAKVETINEINEPVTDLAFAPAAGRRFHVLAVASRDLYIVNIRGNMSNNSSGNMCLDIQTIRFSDHNCPVWRVCWNMLGTMLISTGDDGCVRIWRMNYTRNWKCAVVLKAEGSYPAYESSLNSPTFTAAAAATAKYYKKGTISNPNQVPWH
ncbi:PREDICTED: nucleoporin SEH1-like [Rhagoletis zephyria]|uniref:nucleoporin SEH1-like n=1 Tax=Rhagoletis zephyria TaxID=28612 RepID=UPI0008119645|nr:PREDICTED: nucleoporin SEH1-like [Rhagoletis zephyria]XP_017483751.1 PREDICTED: nucleoporin SEH1-like [Rhagoletis zephyria]